MADAHYQAIASRLVKEIARLGGDVSGFVPPRVAEALADPFPAGRDAARRLRPESRDRVVRWSGDPLSEVVRAIELTGGLFLDGRLTAPWAITARVSARGLPAVHGGAGPDHRLPRGDAGQDAGGRAGRPGPRGRGRRDRAAAAQRPPHRQQRAGAGADPGRGTGIPAGRRRPAAGSSMAAAGRRLDCCAASWPAAAARARSSNSLPRLLVVALDDIASLEWVEASVAVAARELARGRVASAALTSRLSELLLVEALRRYCESASPTGWLGGMRDPQVGRALALLHGDLARPWTIDALAELLGMSRTAFVDRFGRFVGVPPIRYLAQARLAVGPRAPARDAADGRRDRLPCRVRGPGRLQPRLQAGVRPAAGRLARPGAPADAAGLRQQVQKYWQWSARTAFSARNQPGSTMPSASSIRSSAATSKVQAA